MFFIIWNGFILANHINLYITKTCCDKKKTSIVRYTPMRRSRSLYACTFWPPVHLCYKEKFKSGFTEPKYGSRLFAESEYGSGWIKTQAFFLIEKSCWTTCYWVKNYDYICIFILDLHIRLPSSRGSLQPFTRNFKLFKTWRFFFFCFFEAAYSFLYPDSMRIQSGSGSTTLKIKLYSRFFYLLSLRIQSLSFQLCSYCHDNCCCPAVALAAAVVTLTAVVVLGKKRPWTIWRYKNV